MQHKYNDEDAAGHRIDIHNPCHPEASAAPLKDLGGA